MRCFPYPSLRRFGEAEDPAHRLIGTDFVVVFSFVLLFLLSSSSFPSTPLSMASLPRPPPPPLLLRSWEAFRFILHFLGDVHQPMHLTSRERGGNGDPVLWEGRRTNLHSLWDGLLIARTLREQSNYTRPLPSCVLSLLLSVPPSLLRRYLSSRTDCSQGPGPYRAQIESSLTGAIYDPFIRLLLWEGVRSWYRSSLPSWLACPPSSSSLFPSHPSQLILASSPAADKLQQTVCPVRWATETHKVTCELAFPRGYDEHANPPVQIGGDSEFWRGLQGASFVLLPFLSSSSSPPPSFFSSSSLTPSLIRPPSRRQIPPPPPPPSRSPPRCNAQHRPCRARSGDGAAKRMGRCLCGC